MRNIPWFVSNSTHAALDLQELYGVAGDKITVVRNGVAVLPAEKSRAQWRKELQLAPGDFAACMPANIRSAKDHATLIRAWSRVVAAGESAGKAPVLLLAGREAGSADKLRALAADLRLSKECVRFLGEVGDMGGLLQAIDLVVLSSPAEGCPNSLLEAMAAGLPVVGTDVPGIREAVGPDNYEYLAPVGDHERLASIITGLRARMRDEMFLKALAERNRRRVETEFSPAAMFKGYADVINRALGKSPANSG